MRSLLLLISVMSLAACAPSDFDGESYDELLQEAIDAGLPGVALYVRSGADEFDGVAGERILDEADWTPTDLFRIASNSKSFLGVVAAQLAAEGVLDLDTPLADHVAADIIAQIDNAEVATLRQALQHTSGIYDYLESDAFWVLVDDGRTTLWTTEEALAYAYGQPASFPVGTDWEYSNSNYLLAGLVIDDVVGHHHSIEIRNRILDVLGMDHSFYEVEEALTGELVHGYSYYFGPNTLFDTNNLQQGYGLADGGMVASASDLGMYVRALGVGNSMLTDSAREILFADAIETGEGDSYGLGISQLPTDYGSVIAHGGSLEGYTSEMYYYPDSDVTIVAFTNSSDGYFDQDVDLEQVFSEFLAAVEELTF